ncbi:MAG: type II toxin-antitoxin system VapC family toxin [Bacteroidia bacterium]
MIILDTHIWIWWVNGSPKLDQKSLELIKKHEESGLYVSVISCWEFAKLVEKKRLTITCSTLEWLQQALAYPGIQLVDLSLEIIADSTQLPGQFHQDPADQIIVATSRCLDVPLLTADNKILKYAEVVTP